MGIYDREYYRDATGGSGWLTGTAPVCKGLILANVACFVLVLIAPQALDLLDLSSADLLKRGQVWRVLTSTFLHRDVWHIAVNMLVLYIFGREMEAMYGPRDFLAMYLTAGMVGSLAYVLFNAWMGDPESPVIGASGAVYGVVVLYTLYYPGREVLFLLVLPVPMWLLAVFYVGQDVVSLLRQVQGERGAAVAFAAHLGGAAYGLLFRLYDLRWSHLAQWSRPARPKFKIVKPEPFEPEREYPVSGGPAKSVTTSGASRPSPTLLQAQAEEHLEARVDEILAKIAREGRGGLTDEEHRILQEASRRAQAKRSERP